MSWLPNGVDGGERVVVVLQSELVLGVLVGEQAGFAQQGGVLQRSARQLLVNRLQTQKERPMTKPTQVEVEVGQQDQEEEITSLRASIVTVETGPLPSTPDPGYRPGPVAGAASPERRPKMDSPPSGAHPPGAGGSSPI